MTVGRTDSAAPDAEELAFEQYQAEQRAEFFNYQQLLRTQGEAEALTCFTEAFTVLGPLGLTLDQLNR